MDAHPCRGMVSLCAWPRGQYSWVGDRSGLQPRPGHALSSRQQPLPPADCPPPARSLGSVPLRTELEPGHLRIPLPPLSPPSPPHALLSAPTCCNLPSEHNTHRHPPPSSTLSPALPSQKTPSTPFSDLGSFAVLVAPEGFSVASFKYSALLSPWVVKENLSCEELQSEEPVWPRTQQLWEALLPLGSRTQPQGPPRGPPRMPPGSTLGCTSLCSCLFIEGNRTNGPSSRNPDTSAGAYGRESARE